MEKRSADEAHSNLRQFCTMKIILTKLGPIFCFGQICQLKKNLYVQPNTGPAAAGPNAMALTNKSKLNH